LTDSKRTAQASAQLRLGSSKSFRYHATVPFIEATEWSPAFHASRTVTFDQRRSRSSRNCQPPSIR
jgi:hypothetical protein